MDSVSQRCGGNHQQNKEELNMSKTFTMPPEWAPHVRCWMAWPCRLSQWPNGLDKACKAYADVANLIVEFEPVVMVCRPQDEAQARKLLTNRVSLLTMPLDDSWMRDFGPTFVYDEVRTKVGVNWRFNGWGKYTYEQDQHVARQILSHLDVPCEDSPLVNEGGAIHVDGEGSLMVTETVQMNANRNPGLTKQAVEAELSRTLGVRNVIWLPQGLVDDDTDGHIDELACFTGPGQILALVSSDPKDANYGILQRNLDVLKAARDALGNPYDVVTIEQPPASYRDGVRLSMSYVNFYIANGGIVMPSYGFTDYDQEALKVMAQCFPHHQIEQVNSSEIVEGGGNIHCITQQEPV